MFPNFLHTIIYILLLSYCKHINYLRKALYNLLLCNKLNVDLNKIRKYKGGEILTLLDSYVSMGEENKGKVSTATIIGLSTLGIFGVAVAVALIFSLLKKRSLVGDGNAINVDIGAISVTSTTGPLITAAKDMKSFVNENLDFQALSGASETTMAEVGSALTTGAGGIMNDPKAEGKKWDPEKMIPNPQKSVRPEGSLADKFGPSASELSVYLPTTADMWRMEQVGPKFIRRPTQYKKDFNDPRPLIIPKAYNDGVRRGNKPRINESHFKDALDAERKHIMQSNRLIDGDV